MAATLVKKVMLRIAADDGDTEEKLDKISAKADELGRKHPDIKVKVDTAAASAKLAVLRRELKDTGNAAKDDQGRFTALKDAVNVLTLGLSGGWGEMSMFQKVMAGMSLATGLGEPLVAGLTVAVGGLVAGLVAAGAGLGVFGLLAKSNLTTAATAATAAQAAQTTYTSAVAGANAAYNRAMSQATTSTARQSAATARATALQAAYKAQVQATTAAYANLSPAQVTLSKQVGAIQNQWQKFTSSFAGPTSVIVGQLRPLITSVLPDIRKLAMAGETGLSSMLSVLSSKGTGGLDRFVDMLANNAPAAIMRLGTAIGHIITGIGGILKAFMPVSSGMLAGLDSITGKFAQWGQTLSGHSGFKSLMSMFKSETPLAIGVLKQLAGIIKTVVASMAGMSTFSNSKMLLEIAQPILKFVNALLKAHPELIWLVLYLKLAADSGKKLKVAFEGLSGAFGFLKGGVKAFGDLKAGITDSEAAAQEGATMWTALGSNISGAVTAVKGWTIWSKIGAAATKVWTGIQAAFDAVMDANPIALIVIGIAALVAAIVILTVKFKFMRDFWKAAWADIKATAVAAFHILEDAVKVYIAIWKTEWDIAKMVVTEAWRLISDYIRVNVDVIKAVLSWFGRLGSLFRGWWEDAFNAQVSVVSRLIGFVRGIPGKILAGLADLGSMLYNAGAHAIGELISGLSSGIGKIGSVMGGIASKIAGFIGLSPAKEGPLSGGGAPRIRGLHIPQDVAAGIMGGLPQVQAAATRMASAAGIGGRAGVAGGGGAGVMVEWGAGPPSGTLEHALWEWLRENVHIKGGGGNYSVQKALGQRWPAGA